MAPMTTSPTSVPYADRRSPAGRPVRFSVRFLVGGGFTLIELLVVVLIIALLAGMVLVAVNAVSKSGASTKAKADLQSIATALEAYKQDFGSYPLVTTPNTGAAVLCKALLGPSPKTKATGPFEAGEMYQAAYTEPSLPPQPYVALVSAPMGTPSRAEGLDDDWAPISNLDGNDGQFPDYRENGFRVGQKVIDVNPAVPGSGRPGGKVFGPYVQPEKFKVNKDTLFFVDAGGKPILYFPAATNRPKLSTPESGSAPISNGGYVGAGPGGLFNAHNNARFFIRKTPLGTDIDEANAVKRIRAFLGDYGLDGAINKQGTMETDPGGAETLSYILWTAGPDGNFGPNVPTDSLATNPLNLNPSDAADWKVNAQAVAACDDVSNVR